MSPLLQHFSVGCCCFPFLVVAAPFWELGGWSLEVVKGGSSVIGWPHSEAHPGSTHIAPSISSSLMNNLKCKIHRRNTRWPCWKSKCSQVSHLSILCQPKVNSSHASAVLYIWCLVVYIWYLVFLTSDI